MINQLALVFLLMLLASLPSFAQHKYAVEYNTLKEYEGTYEYENNTQLQMGASPNDTTLYAIIGDSKYALAASKKDVFLNNAKQEVQFVRNASGQIAGYQVKNNAPKKVFKLLSKTTTFSSKIWFAREHVQKGSFAYVYTPPKDLQDGLLVGQLQGSGLDAGLIGQMVERIVKEEHPNIHSILIIKDGKLILEEYFYEYDVNTLHQLRSATKSFVSALVGIAIDKKIIKSEEEKVLSYFLEYTLANNAAGKKQISIKNLLTNQSGLACDDHDEQSAGNESKMAYASDWVKFILDLPLVDTPGGKARYCSGGVITLGRIIEKASRQPLYNFSKTYLFTPLGIDNFKWDFKPDPSSSESFCQLYLSPRAMAKFGLLFLNKGRWNDTQVISSQWVEASLAKHTVVNNTEYGYLWWRQWLNVEGVRYDGLAAKGNGGQRIYLWPSLNMVTVITAGSYNTQSSSDKLLIKYVLPSFNKK